MAAFDDVFGPSYQPLMRLRPGRTYGVFGVEPTWHVAWLLATATAMSRLAVYALLRRLEVGAGHACAMSAIMLVFANADLATVLAVP